MAFLPFSLTRLNVQLWVIAPGRTCMCGALVLKGVGGSLGLACTAGPSPKCKILLLNADRDPKTIESVTTLLLSQGRWKRRKLAETGSRAVYQPRGETTRCAVDLRPNPSVDVEPGGRTTPIVRTWRRSTPQLPQPPLPGGRG